MNYKYYDIFKQNFITAFNNHFKNNIKLFDEAVMYSFEKIFGGLSFPSYEVIELQGLYSDLTFDEIEIVKKIKFDIEKGKNYEKYMSKSIENVMFVDTLKNLYDIYHFHLGKDIGEKFVKRSNKILFIYFSPERKAYMICVKKHPKGKEWGSIEPIKILYNQYPMVFKDRILKANKIEPEIVDDKDYQLLYKLKVSCPIKVKDEVYVTPFNFGINQHGINLKINLLKNKFLNSTITYFGNKDIYSKYEFIFNKNELLIIAYLKSPFKFKLEFYSWNGKNLYLKNNLYLQNKIMSV